MIDFDFLPQIPIDSGHTLDQLTGRFQTVKDGLPELVKNAKDQYARLGVVERELRHIVVIVSSTLRSLAVLDFAGAQMQDFNGWKTWSSRTAGRGSLADDIEAGHGNGGKSFMVRGSADEAFMESCYEEARTKMGFKNDEAECRYLPGYARESGRPVYGVSETDPRRRLDGCLASMELDYEQLPSPARRAFDARDSFTFVRVGSVREWSGRRLATVRNLVRQIQAELVEHGQAALTLETCSVWILVDGESMSDGPLVATYPNPLPGFEALDRAPVPDDLTVPDTGERVATGSSGDQKYLQLATSREPLRRADRRKALNVIRVRNGRNVVANWSVADLSPRSESAFVYGQLLLPALTPEHLAGAERHGTVDTPLVLAVRAWVAAQVEDLASRIQQAQARNHRPEDRTRANDALERMRELMRQYLRGDTLVGPTERPRGTRVDEIVFEGGRASVALAAGTTVPLQVACFELTPQGKRLPVSVDGLEMCCETGSVLDLVSTGLVRGVWPGRTKCWFRTGEGGVESNRVDVEVVSCTGVEIMCPDRVLLQGEHVRLTMIFRTAAGGREDLLVEAATRNDLLMEGMVDESEMGKISRNGWFTAGHVPGVATVRVRFGPAQQDTNTDTLNIGTEVAPPRRRPDDGNGTVPDVPVILLCGQEAPGMGEYTPDQRTHPGGEYHPTIIEDEPPFEHVIWINPDSKEALRVRKERHGPTPTGVGRIASKSFLQFIALKCFEVLKRLKVRQERRDQQMTEVEYRRDLAQAELDCSDFIDRAFDLADELYHGEMEAD
jgi:hypothetical protein